MRPLTRTPGANWNTQAPRPWAEKLDFTTGTRTRIFDSPADAYETMVAPLDDDYSQYLYTHESATLIKDVYLRAYESGCKGCTTWRPNDITGAILSLDEQRKAVPKPEPVRAEPTVVAEVFPAPPSRTKPASGAGGVVYMTQPLDRPEALPGTTYKVRWPETDHAIYITINDIIEGGRRRPFEIFINSKNMEHYAWTVALTRM